MPDPKYISSESQRQLQRILMKITAYHHSLPDGHAVGLDELQSKGILSSAEIDFMAAHSIACKPHRASDEQGQLHEILMKITEYQRSLPDGRAVELDELQREGVLSLADMDFMAAHSVTYKPHRASDYHAMDMLHMPLSDGSCVFTGPSARTPVKRRIQLKEFQTVIQSFLRIPRPDDELLLHINFAENDGVGVSPEAIFFIFASDYWRERLPAIRSVAAEFGFASAQDEVVQNHHTLSFLIPRDADRTSAAVVALLGRGCGMTEERAVCYAAGALDEL